MIVDMNNNVIKYRIEEHDNVDEFSYKMIRANKIPGFITVGRENNTMLYAVSKLVPLVSYLETNVHTVDDALGIAAQYYKILESAENYMIPAEEIVLNPMLSFVDPIDGSLMLCCVPCREATLYSRTGEEFRAAVLGAAGYETDAERLKAFSLIQGREDAGPAEKEKPEKKQKKKVKLRDKIKFGFGPVEEDDMFSFSNEELPEGVNVIAVRSTGEEYPLMYGPDIIGTDASKASICFPHNINMSPTHSSITLQHGKYYIADLNSSTGTMVNGQALEPGKIYELHSADLISVAGEELVFSRRT